MATRTQKAAMKTKAQAKAGKAPKAKATSKPAPKTPTKAKAGKQAKAASPKTAKAAPAGASPSDAKPTLSERFWHRIGLGAKAKEERAHEHHLQHEERIRHQIEQDRLERQRVEEEARLARKTHDAADRKATQKAAREMARIAREEDARLKREAEEAQANAVKQAAEGRKAAAAARREQARVAKLQEAAEAQSAQEQAQADAEREAQEKAAASAQAAEERAAKRRDAAEARREKARQEELAAEAKAEERRLAREEKAARKALEEEQKAREEELAQLEAEATARRQAQRMEVTIRQKASAEDEAELADAADDVDEEVEGEAVALDDQLEQDAEDEVEDAAKAATPKAANGHAKPAPKASDLDTQADRVAEELRSRRSKPITFDADDDAPAPTLPVGRKAREEEPKQVLQLDPAPPARIPEMATPRGLSIPEHFLLLSLEDGWDERRERAAPGQLGGALAGALALELLLQGKLRVQRDRFQLTDERVDDAAAAVAARLLQSADQPSLRAMEDLAKALPQLLPPYKDRMAARGLVEHRAWRHMGMFYRSQTALVDGDAQERMRSKLARAIAGGGRPDAPTILSLGLLEASGLFGVVVPEGAQAYNRKRLNGLLAGKDVMGYKVDDELRGIQEMAVRTILDNVRLMTVRG